MGFFHDDGPSSKRHLTSWDQIRDRSPEESTQYRDVYNDQQFGRSNLKDNLHSPLVLKIFTWASAIFLTIMWWLCWSILEFLMSDISLGFSWYMHHPTVVKFVTTAIVGVASYLIINAITGRTQSAQDEAGNTEDINQYMGDQHIALPEEIQKKFDWFPDVGATSDVQFSSMISHMALMNKGIKPIQVAKRSDMDIVDETGEIEVYKGDVLRDDDGEIEYEDKPMFDTQFMEALFDASGLPKNTKKFRPRHYYDATQIAYNPDGRNRDKLGKYKTVADLINSDWEFPWYEPQRPAGAYIVDTAPVNTI